MSGTTAPVLEVTDLSIDLSRDGTTIHAVRDVTLAVAPGEVLGLVGQSGSGKSVLGLGVMGLLPATADPRLSGSITLAGTDMVGATSAERRATLRRHLGAVFQDPMTSLDPTMTVGGQLAEVCDDLDHALRLLRSVGVPDAADRLRAYPHQLSGGLRQRVMIALAVARRPSLLLADEPTTALDVSVQAQVLDLLLQMRDEYGCGVVLVTHDLGVASQVCDRIAVMCHGRIVEHGPVDTVLETPQHPYTRGLLASRITLTTPRDRPLPVDADAARPAAVAVDRTRTRTAEDRLAIDADGVIAAPRREQPAPALWPVVATGSETVVRVSGARRTFRAGPPWSRRETRALRGVDLEIRAGEAVAVVGESGCGKSTLLRCVAGLERLDEGSVEVDGAPPQMVFQDAGASLTPWLTVGAMLEERLHHHGVGGSRSGRRERVAEALRAVSLPPETARARADQLSGGQRQRVAMARAVVVPPGVLLADEPTSALDVSVAAGVLNMLGRLRRELGMALLMVTHDLAAARIVADRIVVMNHGVIVEEGAVDDVCAHPRDPYTRSLLDAVPGAHHRRQAVRTLGGAA